MLLHQAAVCSSTTLASVSYEGLSLYSILPGSQPRRLLSRPVSSLWHPYVLSTCHSHNRSGVSVNFCSLALAATPIRTAHRRRLRQAQASNHDSNGVDGGLSGDEGESDACSSSSDGTKSTVASGESLANEAGTYGRAQFGSSKSPDPGTERLPKSFDTTFQTASLSSSVSTSADRLTAASTDSASQPLMSSSVSDAAMELSGRFMVLPETSSDGLGENEGGQTDGLKLDGKGKGSRMPSTEAGAAQDRVKGAMERARAYKNTGQAEQPLGSSRTGKATSAAGFGMQSRTKSGTESRTESAKASRTGSGTVPDAPPSSEDNSKPQSDVATSPPWLARVLPGDDGDGQRREQLPGPEPSPVPATTIQNSGVVDKPSSGRARAGEDILASSATEVKLSGAKLSLAKAAAYRKERSNQGTQTGAKELKTDSLRKQGGSQFGDTEPDPIYSLQSTRGPINDEASEQARGQQPEPEPESLGEGTERLPQVDEPGAKLPEVEIITRDGIRRPVFSKKSTSYNNPNNGKKAGSAAKPALKPKPPQSGGFQLPSTAPSAFEGFADQNRGRSNPGGYLQQGRAMDTFDMSPPRVLPEVEIITRDAAMASDMAPEDSSQDEGLYKPKVSTWGVFPRPKNISEKYGGGRTIKPGEKLISDEEMATKNQRIQQRLAEYRKTMGIDIDPATKASIDKAMSCGLDLMNKGQLQQALFYFDDVISQCVFRSEPYGEAALQRALCLDSLSRREEAKELYKTLVSHPTATVRRKASQMLFGFQAMAKLKMDMSNQMYNSEQYASYFNRFSNGYAQYKATPEDLEDGDILKQATPYFLVLLLPLVLVFVLAYQKGSL